MPAQLSLDLEWPAVERRVACLVLPELACELARWSLIQPGSPSRLPSKSSSAASQPRRRSNTSPAIEARPLPPRPFGVVLLDGVDRKATLGELTRTLEPRSRLGAVDAIARRLGIIEGQTIIEARCLHSALEICTLPRNRIADTLKRIAESLLDRASVVAVEAPDTIWLELGPVLHALGGEAAIAQELLERVRCLGHAARLAVAPGPRLAQLFARWSASGHPDGLHVSRAQALSMLQSLPLLALPLSREQRDWLMRLGLMKIGDLARLPEGELVTRLGSDSSRLIALTRGQDNEPLFAIQPERILSERLEWEQAVEGLERLRFVLRRLTTNIEARLAARGEAAERLSVTLQHDRAIARHRGVNEETHLHFEFAQPLWYAEDFERIIVARCERTQLSAPVVAIELRVIAPTPKVPRQLELGRLVAGYGSTAPAEEGLPVLLAELEIEIGQERIGLLRLGDSHRPENKSLFVPYSGDTPPAGRQPKKAKYRKAVSIEEDRSSMSEPANNNARSVQRTTQTLQGITRLLERPIALKPPLQVGATLFLEHEAYVIERLQFEERLDGIEWWDNQAIARDYLRLYLQSAHGGVEALAYVEPRTGHCFLQAVVD